MTVYCEMNDCKYWKNNECCCETINIGIDATCVDCEPLYVAPEYRQRYWIAKISEKTGKPVKALRFGKKVTINEVDFYTEDNTLLPESQIYLTHARTGHLVGSMDCVKANFAEFIKRQETVFSVEDLPEEDTQ